MGSEPTIFWWESRTNISAVVLLVVSMSALWGGKLAGLPSEAQEAIVTVAMTVGVPLIIYFRNKARSLIGSAREYLGE